VIAGNENVNELCREGEGQNTEWGSLPLTVLIDSRDMPFV
jgi:hypothetical protein